MSTAEFNALHILHVVSAILMVAVTFYAFAAPAEARKKVMISSGILSLLVLLTGARMWQGNPGVVATGYFWAIAKVLCWLVLSALAGLAFRRRHQVGALTITAIAAVVVAVVMVYLKPF